jgi:hypothetical protein
MDTLTKILERIGENLAWVARMYGAPVDPLALQRRPELSGPVHPPVPLEREGSVPWPSHG